MSPAPSPQASPELTLTIEKLVHGGAGLAHEGSLAVFVPYVAPAETVRVAIDRSRKGYAEGRLLEIVTASPDRVVAPCSVYGHCGGCQLQHIHYVGQLECKRQILAETLARIGGFRNIEVPPLIASTQSFGYRNRARFAVLRSSGRVTLAFHQEASQHLVPISECPVVAPPLNETLSLLNNLLNAGEGKALGLQEVTIAASMSTGELVMRYVAERGTRREAERWFARVLEGRTVKGQVLLCGRGRQSRRWLDGDPSLTEVFGDCKFRISDGAFAQANWNVNDNLVETVLRWVMDAGHTELRVLELYAGIGNFGLRLARKGAFVTLVEESRTALTDARANARINHIGRCRFRLASAEANLAASLPGEYDLVLLDPPRTGLSKEALQGVLRLGPERVLYISCEPATLARDLCALQDGGYRLSRLQGFDMFPHTMHIETLVELVRHSGRGLH